MDWVIQRGIFDNEEHVATELTKSGRCVHWHTWVPGGDLVGTEFSGCFYGSSRHIHWIHRNTEMFLVCENIEDYEYSRYSQYALEHLLNKEYFLVPKWFFKSNVQGIKNGNRDWMDDIIETFGHIAFVRPDTGCKPFTGMVIASMGSLVDKQDISESGYGDEFVVVTSAKKISDECRFWFKGRHVVSYTSYPGNREVPGVAIDAARKIAVDLANSDYFDPMIVVDLCLHEGTWKIVEVNCVNAAGMYFADVVAIADAVDLVAKEYLVI
jgi:hypothetical protein